MAGNVQFDEDAGLKSAIPKVRPRTMADSLVKWGVARTTNQAYTILLVVALVLLGASYYLLMYAIPSEPQLGADVLRPGEKVPSYVGQNQEI